jgi:hypothetical protein
LPGRGSKQAAAEARSSSGFAASVARSSKASAAREPLSIAAGVRKHAKPLLSVCKVTLQRQRVKQPWFWS